MSEKNQTNLSGWKKFAVSILVVMIYVFIIWGFLFAISHHTYDRENVVSLSITRPYKFLGISSIEYELDSSTRFGGSTANREDLDIEKVEISPWPFRFGHEYIIKASKEEGIHYIKRQNEYALYSLDSHSYLRKSYLRKEEEKENTYLENTYLLRELKKDPEGKHRVEETVLQADHPRVKEELEKANKILEYCRKRFDSKVKEILFNRTLRL